MPFAQTEPAASDGIMVYLTFLCCIPVVNAVGITRIIINAGVPIPVEPIVEFRHQYCSNVARSLIRVARPCTWTSTSGLPTSPSTAPLPERIGRLSHLLSRIL